MSRQAINEYRAELDRLRSASGSRRESVLREAFKDLLKGWGRKQDLVFVPEHDIVTPQRNRIYVDGALLHALRVPFGYWEAKDADDDLDAEIGAKRRKGYPTDNIIYSDDATAVLLQDGAEVMRRPMDDTEALLPLLVRFFAHERAEVADFNKAVRQFAHDLPAVLDALRGIVAAKRTTSPAFAAAEAAFLKHAKNAINPAVTEEDVQEMLIQHILTEDIFAKVFDNPDFHRQNNIAAELYKLEETLFGYGEKQRLLRALQPYYAGISRTAAVIQSHSEKQGFLKGLYENFYKVYNAKAADRLGVVYTPGEIVRFMIRSADWLCEKHFGKNLIDPGVEILDPATGTGTFIVELLEHFRGDRDKLRHKYKEELHANEIGILPYYVANLNIEATYQAITGQFAEFENLCLVDTLDNVAALKSVKELTHVGDLYGSLSSENMVRINRQNERKISVVIGNPPYNANQQGGNDNNQNRKYPFVDASIKATYIKASSAQKTKLYDMYARFYRWSTDRLGDEGLIAFVTNNSFLNARTFDGFRKKVAEDFSEAWIIDLKGNARTSGSRRQMEGGNVFENKIKVGIAIAFFVRTKEKERFVVNYLAVEDYAREDDKREFVAGRRLETDAFTRIIPRPDGTWLEQSTNSLDGLVPTVDPASKKGAKNKNKLEGEFLSKAIFESYSNGIVSARDDWMTDRRFIDLRRKVKAFVTVYKSEQARWAGSSERNATADKEDRLKALTNFLSREIKWTSELEEHLDKGSDAWFRASNYASYQDRPFSRLLAVFAPVLTHRRYRQHTLFPSRKASNLAIGFSGAASQKPFQSLAVDRLPSYDLLEKTQFLPRYRFTKTGERIDNITDWALAQFVGHYGKAAGITKDAIFNYVYAVLHDPHYRETYALNLKREFPRIRFYADFARWAAWGEALMAMHIGYEEVEPWPVERVDAPGRRAPGTQPKPVLRSDPAAGLVVVDADTQVTGIPASAWDYRLGNRSGIDWVLDQHKEKRPRDPTIAAKFNSYRFADYKESMIVLLARVVRVSVNTVAITDAMRAATR